MAVVVAAFDQNNGQRFLQHAAQPGSSHKNFLLRPENSVIGSALEPPNSSAHAVR